MSQRLLLIPSPGHAFVTWRKLHKFSKTPFSNVSHWDNNSYFQRLLQDSESTWRVKNIPQMALPALERENGFHKGWIGWRLSEFTTVGGGEWVHVDHWTTLVCCGASLQFSPPGLMLKKWTLRRICKWPFLRVQHNGHEGCCLGLWTYVLPLYMFAVEVC